MAFWTMVIFIVWLRAHVKLSRRGPYEIPNRYKGALVLSKAIEQDFAEHEKPGTMNEKDFTEHRSKILKGGTVWSDSVQPPLDSKRGVWSSTKKWMRQDRWWCVALAVDAIWLSVGWIALKESRNVYEYEDVFDSSRSSQNAYRNYRALEGFYAITLWAWPAVIFAMIIGTTRKSRLFFVSCGIVIGFVITTCLLSCGHGMVV